MTRYEDVRGAVRERPGRAGPETAREAVGGLVLRLSREERPAWRDALPPDRPGTR